MAITIIKDESRDLTIHEISGHVTENEMHEALDKFYNQEPTSFLLWDMSNAKFRNLSPSMLQLFTKRAIQFESKREVGKTAVYAPGDLLYGFARMSEVFIDIMSTKFKFSVFRSMEDAMDWFKEDK